MRSLIGRVPTRRPWDEYESMYALIGSYCSAHAGNETAVAPACAASMRKLCNPITPSLAPNTNGN